MEDLLELVCEVYLDEKAKDHTDAQRLCTKCNKKIRNVEDTLETDQNENITNKRNLSNYLYQSSNSICTENLSQTKIISDVTIFMCFQAVL